MCNCLLHNLFLENAKTWDGRTTLNGRKRGIGLGDQKKNYTTPTNEDLGQTSNWSKLVAAYLPVSPTYGLRSSCFFFLVQSQIAVWSLQRMRH